MQTRSPSQTTLGRESDNAPSGKEPDVVPVPGLGAKNASAESTPPHDKDKSSANVTVMAAHPHKAFKEMNEIERSEYLSEVVEDGEHKYHKLGWVQLVVVLIVEAIALGSLSLPK